MSKMTVSAVYQAMQIATLKREAATLGEKTNYGQAVIVYQAVDSILSNCQVEIEVSADVQLGYTKRVGTRVYNIMTNK